MGEFVKVANLSEIAPDTMKRVVVNGLDIALVNSAGQISAVENQCTHQYCALHYGWVEGGRIICPCHGAEFEAATGKALDYMGEFPLTMFATKVEGDEVFLDTTAPRMNP